MPRPAASTSRAKCRAARSLISASARACPAAGSWARTSTAPRALTSRRSTGGAPHPLFFDRPRPFATTVEDLKRSEQALHLSVGYRLPVGEKLDVHFYAGPSQFRFSQEVVSDVVVTDTGGFNTTLRDRASQEERLGWSRRRRRVVSGLPVGRYQLPPRRLPALCRRLVGVHGGVELGDDQARRRPGGRRSARAVLARARYTTRAGLVA